MFDILKKDTKNPELDPKALANLLANYGAMIQQNTALISGLQLDRDIIVKLTKIQKKYDHAAAEANRKNQQQQSKNMIQKQGIVDEKSVSGPAIKTQ